MAVELHLLPVLVGSHRFHIYIPIEEKSRHYLAEAHPSYKRSFQVQYLDKLGVRYEARDGNCPFSGSNSVEILGDESFGLGSSAFLGGGV